MAKRALVRIHTCWVSCYRFRDVNQMLVIRSSLSLLCLKVLGLFVVKKDKELAKSKGE